MKDKIANKICCNSNKPIVKLYNIILYITQLYIVIEMYPVPGTPHNNNNNTGRQNQTKKTAKC